MSGDVPIGSGLSSSAAVEMVAVQAFAAIGEFVVAPAQAARIGQKAEQVFVGMNCGLMDQLASALGQPDHVLLIDCRDLSFAARAGACGRGDPHRRHERAPAVGGVGLQRASCAVRGRSAGARRAGAPRCHAGRCWTR